MSRVAAISLLVLANALWGSSYGCQDRPARDPAAAARIARGISLSTATDASLLIIAEVIFAALYLMTVPARRLAIEEPLPGAPAT
ncbi:MAG TPA: hypothetical protein VFU22_25180 [Roseiflexaceae bacterium]|nr:hypothetical protein [Roseiflexaceae bacterium]